MRLVYSPEAVQDLVRLRQFIAEKDPGAASRIAGELVARIEHLMLFPGMGRPVAESPGPGAIRDLMLGAYVIRYSHHPGAIAVLRIWHGLEHERVLPQEQPP